MLKSLIIILLISICTLADTQYIDVLKRETVTKVISRDVAVAALNGNCLSLNLLRDFTEGENSSNLVALNIKRTVFDNLQNVSQSVDITNALILALARPVETREIPLNAPIPQGFEHQEIRQSITDSGLVRIVRRKPVPTRICR